MIAEKLAEKLVGYNEQIELHKKALNICPVPMFIQHRDGTCAYGNSAYLRLVGAETLEDVVGEYWESFIHPDDLVATKEAWSRVLTGERTKVNITSRIRRKDGTIVHIYVHAEIVEGNGFLGFCMPLQCKLCTELLQV